MKGKARLLCVVLAGFLLLLAIGCAKEVAPSVAPEAAEVTTIRLSQAQGYVGQKDLIYSEYPSMLAKVVDDLSEGTVKIVLYGPGELYATMYDMILACALGDLPMYWGDIGPALAYQGMLPETEIAFRFPFVGPDIEDRIGYTEEFLAGPQGARLKEMMADEGLTLLEVSPCGATGLAMTERADTEADFAKLKIRGSGGIALVAASATGATEVQIAYEEVPMALKTGVVEGVFTDIPSFVESTMWGAGCTHWVRNYCIYIGFPGFLVNTGFWEELPQDVKDVILEAVEQIDPWSERAAVRLNAWAFKEAAKHVTIYDLAPDVLAACQERLAAEVYADLEAVDADMFNEMLRLYSQWTPE